MNQQPENLQNTISDNKVWTKPELQILSINADTLGAAVAVNDGGGLS